MAEQDTLRSGEHNLYSRVRNDHEESAIYDDPTPWLDVYDSRDTNAKPVPPLPRPMEVADIDEALADSRTLTPDQDQDSTFRRYQTYRNEEDEEGAADIMWSDEWDSTESEESDDEPTLSALVSQLSTGGSDTIPILGSLMLSRESSVIEQQGIFQGLVVDEQDREKMGILPVAVYMTQTLEKFGSQLEDLSVRVTRETEIVPTSPFDFNAPRNGERTKSASSSDPPTVRRQRAVHTQDKQKQEQTSSSGIKYTGNIVRPPILPPLDDSETTAEKKKYQVMYHLLQSEAGFLTSLKIAVEVYMMPLKELAAGSSPILDTSQVVKLFGPVELLLQIHELFYTALCMRTKEWSSKSQIGDVFLSSFNRREVKKHYTDYVNNFTDAMSIIERGINKKQRLVDFLQQQLEGSPSQLSLQALLLKPIQRFPQYILFLKDFIKYTSAQHGDCVILQMAQANIEGTAEFLNEAKRQAEQVAIVRYLSSRFDKLPFRLNETQQVLLRQDTVTFLKKVTNNVPKYSQRQLLLFSDMIICAAKKENRLSWIGGSNVNAGDVRLEYKWHCQLPQITVTDPDYENQTVPYIHPSVNGKHKLQVQRACFRNLKDDIRQLDDDFHSLTKIVVHVFSLHRQYTGLSQSNIQTDIRVLQRELETKKNQLVLCEPGRLDLIKTSKNDNSGTLAQYTILFDSEKRKQEWLRLLHFAKLKQGQTNTLTWIYEQEEEEEELIDDDSPNFGQGSKTLSTVYNLPLFVDCFKLAPNSFNVECATCVGSKTVWFATGSSDSAQITVFRCLSPSPILVETFPIETRKSPACWLHHLGMPNHTTQHFLLLLYSADTKKCVGATQLPYAITCIQKYKNRVFVGTTGGTLVVFTQLRGKDWDLENKRTVPASDCAIECLCAVDKKLWIGSGQRCIIMGMGSLRLQASIRVTSKEGATVQLLTSTGIGVWVSLSKGAIMYLYHCDTRKSLQEIDTRGSLENISEYARLQNKLTPLNSLTVTSLLASRGNLWVGTSVGAILVYRIPHLNGLPIVNGKPILASDGHRGPVRVILRIRTKLDISTARFDQFISDEERMNAQPQLSHADQRPAQPISKKAEHLEPKRLVDKSHGRSSPAPVDMSKPPPVSQIIKQLERKKSNIVHVRPTGPQLRYTDSESEAIDEERKEEVNDEVNDDGGYEDASLILNEYLQAELVEDEQVYDEVPTEDLSDAMEDEEEEDSMAVRRPRGNTVIDPTRYEMQTNSLDSRCASVFTLINEDPLESSARIQTKEQVDGSFFVFTGGSGLANFRSEQTQNSLSLQSRKQESFPSRDAMGNLPCVLAYQLPNM